MACSAGSPQPVMNATPVVPRTPVAYQTSLELDALPAGPYRSAAAYCDRWSPPRARAVAEQNEQCTADPESCISGCGLVAVCNITKLSAASLGSFRAAELVEISASACGAADCYLALTDASGTWFVHEVNSCSSGEGVSASLETIAVGVVGEQLVWQYAHHVREDDVLDERRFVRCRATAGAPACSADDE